MDETHDADTDEIARMRALWCEEKSKSMTFHAEVERLRAEVAALKAQADLPTEAAWLHNATLRADLAQRTAERDEARREVCQWVACGFDGAKNAARLRGWDCFDAKEAKP